jgi:hypothetical protein
MKGRGRNKNTQLGNKEEEEGHKELSRIPNANRVARMKEVKRIRWLKS